MVRAREKSFASLTYLLLTSHTDLVLKQAAVPVVPRKVCQAWHSRKVIGESVICAGYAEGGHDSCGVRKVSSFNLRRMLAAMLI